MMLNIITLIIVAVVALIVVVASKNQEFGNDKHPTDLIQNGVLQVASSSPNAFCGQYHDLMALARVATVYWEAQKGSGWVIRGKLSISQALQRLTGIRRHKR